MLEIERICDVFEEELRLCKPKDDFVDYAAFRTCVATALKNGILVFPKTEEELLEEAHYVIQGNYISNFRRSNGVEYKIIGLGPSFQTTLKYNIKDALSSDKKIAATARRILSSLKYNEKNRPKKWQKIQLELNLSLEKGASLYRIDEYFERLFTEIQKTHDINFNIIVNFGERELDKYTVRYLIDGVDFIGFARLQHTIHKFATGQLLFREFPNDRCWDLTQVMKANNCIQNLAQTAKNNNLSPFEALLFVSTWAQKNIKYYDIDSIGEDTNTFVAAVNNQKVRCVGFSQFVNAAIKRLSPAYLNDDNTLMPNGTIGVSYKKNKHYGIEIFRGDHSQSTCYLNDKKYNIRSEVIVDVLGFPGYGTALRKLDRDITLLAMAPIATYSILKSKHEQYKIYSENLETSNVAKKGVFTTKIYVDGKNQSKVLKETERNDRIAKGWQMHSIGITTSMLTQAYEVIIPLIFPELKPGDMIAPTVTFLDDEKQSWEWDKTIDIIKQDDIKSFWMKQIENYENQNKDKNKKVEEEGFF